MKVLFVNLKNFEKLPVYDPISLHGVTYLVGVHGFRGSRFHSCPRTAFGMRIYEKSVSFVSPNPKFEAKLAIYWENEHF